MNDERHSAILKAMADETRLRLIRLLGREELNVQELCEILQLPQPRISRHLSVLRSEKLVQDRREGTRIYYSLVTFSNDEKGIADFLMSICSQEHPDADRLRATLKKRESLSREFADNVADKWDDIGAQLHNPSLALLALSAMIPAGLKVADLGCGTGLMLPVLSRIADRVYAVDHSDEMLAKAEDRCAALSITNAEFIQSSFEGLQGSLPECDALLMHYVLHQVPSPQTVLAQLVGHLKEGGSLVIVDRQKHEDENAAIKFGSLWLGFDRDKIESCLAGLDVELDYMPLSPSEDGMASFIATIRKVTK